MTVSCHLLRPNHRQEIPLEAVSGRIAEGQGLVWLELRGIDHPTLKHLERELNLHELAVEDALSAHQRPKVEDYPGGLFLVLRTARWWNDSVVYGETHVFCGPGHLACIRHDPGPGYGNVQDRLRAMIGDAMQLSLATAALEQSDSVQKLAGWGALFAVPTLVFSLYGMNFRNMPELDWPWGYPLTLAATAAACGWLYHHLKLRGWI